MPIRRTIEIELPRDHPDSFAHSYEPHTLSMALEDEQKFATLAIRDVRTSTTYYVPREEIVKALRFLIEH